MFIPAQVTQADLSIELAGDSKTMLASRSQVLAFVAIAFYFLIIALQAEKSRFHKLLMLQRPKRSKRKRMVLLQINTGRARLASRVHDREISSGLRAFYKEISWKIGGKKISGYQGIR